MLQLTKKILGPKGVRFATGFVSNLKGFVQTFIYGGRANWAYIGKTVKRAGGVYSRLCPICDYSGRFRAFGEPPRWDATCLECHSLERHRLLFLAVNELNLIPDNCDLLHFAPEPSIRKFLEPKTNNYKTADLFSPYVDLKLNIEDIDQEDGSFDVIVCNHVLEHVNDKPALKEMNRILKPGGVLLAMVPIVEGWDKTYENPDVKGAELSEIHFGQCDHVRFYGADLRERIKSAGFSLSEYTAEGQAVIEYGLLRGEKVFICRK